MSEIVLPPYQPSSTDGELLPVVDSQDRVYGAAPRRQVHRRQLMHRAVHLVVMNEKGEVLLQQRSARKDSHPGWWDISVGGHVDVGETYEDAATRELREELGIAGAFREVAQRSPAGENGWEFVRVYECRHEGPFAPNADEIDAVRWVPAAQLLTQFSPSLTDHETRITASGLEGIRLWAKATGRA